MSKILFEQISENEIEVSIPAETPMEMVQELTKSLISKGLVEDLRKSTLSTRYFYRPQDNANELADKLIKSLENMSGLNKAKKHWWASSQEEVDAWKAKNRAIDRADQAKRAGVKIPTSTPNKPPAPASGVNTLPSVPNKIHNPALSGTVDYYKKGTQKSEVMHKQDDPDCACEKCDMEKSGYGPKRGGQYTLADNIRRKANNTGDVTGFGSNVNTKQYTSAKFSNTTPQTDPKLKRRQPVKQWTPEQIAEENAKRGLKKSWGEHLPFPSVEEELMALAKETLGGGEDVAANQLAQMMHNKNLLKFNQPSSQEFTAAGEAMGLGVSEEMLKSEEQAWGNTMNNWLAEATKPISQRFNSEEEELAYWSRIKVAEKKEDDYGY